MYYLITRDQCSFCEKAKDLLSSSGEPYFEINVLDEKYRFMASLLTEAGLHTVPQIWKGKAYVGGYTDLKGRLTASKEN